MLGANQDNNDLSKNVIIKCHQCGDTNLRYIGNKLFSSDKRYVCGNGHATWGAVDDWSIRGQSDSAATEVKDCCCEGVECNFPKSINVKFDGLIGVQAREGGTLNTDGSWSDNLAYDLLQRTAVPHNMCPICYDLELDPDQNGGFDFNTGGVHIEKDCKASNDIVRFRSPPGGICPMCENTVTTDDNGRCVTSLVTTATIDSRVPGVCPPQGPIEVLSDGSELFGAGECDYQVPIQVNSTCCPIVGTPPWANSAGSGADSFFDTAGGYPIPGYGIPTFMTPLECTCPGGAPATLWSNNVTIPENPLTAQRFGHPYSSAFYFVTSKAVKQQTFYAPNGQVGCCTWVWVKHFVVYRTNPLVDKDSFSGWTITQQGINPAFQDMKYFYQTGPAQNCDPDAYASPPTIAPDVTWFCDMSNLDWVCADCEGFPSSSFNGEELSPRSIWPWRIPPYTSAGYGPTTYQLIRNADNNFSGDGKLTHGECGCRDLERPLAGPVQSYGCTEPNDTGEVCNSLSSWQACHNYQDYPPCLEKGNLKCSDVDAKYRVPCANPVDAFVVNLSNAGSEGFPADKNLRVSYAFTSPPNGPAGAWMVSVIFHPMFAEFRQGAITGKWYELFTWPQHPSCPHVPNVGWLDNYTKQGLLNVDFNIPLLRAVSGGQMNQFAPLDPGSSVSQPHCLRRVKSPSVTSPYWAVNTADISEQTLILDRYNVTGPVWEYEWKDVDLARDGNSSQKYVGNAGDKGITDYIEGRSFPYPWSAHSGSIEEPELIAIIHSQSGEGAQVCFQTFPVSYEDDDEHLIDVAYDQIEPARGSCEYKHRQVVHGYGVMYPFAQDPQWKKGKDTLKGFLQYPNFMSGKNYKVGDKIEFRCWKTLTNNPAQGLVAGQDEHIWEEECVETTIATATVTELNVIRVAPDQLNMTYVVKRDGDTIHKQKNTIDIDTGVKSDLYIDWRAVKNKTITDWESWRFGVNHNIEDYGDNTKNQEIDTLGINEIGAIDTLLNEIDFFDGPPEPPEILGSAHFQHRGVFAYEVGDIIEVIVEGDGWSQVPGSDYVLTAPRADYGRSCPAWRYDDDGNYVPDNPIQGAWKIILVVEEIKHNDEFNHDGEIRKLKLQSFYECGDDLQRDYSLEYNQGNFYYLWTNGGIRWWEFDEETMFVGNCPCETDYCADPDYESDPAGFFPEFECNEGCASKDCITEGADKPQDEDPQFGFWKWPPSHKKMDAIPLGFPAFPNLGCIGFRYQDPNSLEWSIIPRLCYGADRTATDEDCNWHFNCSYSCRVEDNQQVCDLVGSWMLKNNDDCLKHNAVCRPKILPPNPSKNEKIQSDCECFPNGNFQFLARGVPSVDYIGNLDGDPKIGWGVDLYDPCYPINNTWEMVENNYAKSACALMQGETEPVIPAKRAYINPLGPHGYKIVPPRRDQYRAFWIPELDCLKARGEAKAQSLGLDEDAFVAPLLASKGCNPLSVDKFYGTTLFPNEGAQSGPPCRKLILESNDGENNWDGLPGDQIGKVEGSPPPESLNWTRFIPFFVEGPSLTRPSVFGVQRQQPDDRESVKLYSDNYCRVYGFYQQRQPSCEMLYKGQYILRAAQSLTSLKRSYTDCEPVIEDIEIKIKKKEARIDVSIGAPYDQDYLIPENLPLPYRGRDGFLESTADAWNDPSLSGVDNTRFFDHGFYEPNRKGSIAYLEIPGESADPNDLLPVLQINPTFDMYPVDGGDYFPSSPNPNPANGEDPGGGIPQDIYLTGVWDLPDPRSNIRIGATGLDIGDLCLNPTYTGWDENYFLVESGVRNSFIYDCPYPWENYCADSPSDPNKCDFYCMFKNNSAEVVVSGIDQCEYCHATEVFKTNRYNYVIDGWKQNFLPESFFNYTYRMIIEENLSKSNPDPNLPEGTEDPDTKSVSWILFRCYSSDEGEFDYNVFESMLYEYMDIWLERKHTDPDGQEREEWSGLTTGQKFLLSMQDDTERRILCNFLFEGDKDRRLANLTKVEMYRYSATFPLFEVGVDMDYERYRDDSFVRRLGWPDLIVTDLSLIHSETRCEYPKIAGSIAVSGVNVVCSGDGYAFEIEERVPITGVWIPELFGRAEVTMVPKVSEDSKRRREIYQAESFSINQLVPGDSDPATGFDEFYVGQRFTIEFSDTDFRRDKLYIETKPVVEVTDYDVSEKKITSLGIVESGRFYKYIGTDEHRAFPISIVVNNYWNHPEKEGSEIGRNAIFRPIVGVDPADQRTYGKIKRIVVEYGGVEYVAPDTYWTIDTKTGRYDPVTGDLTAGLDIQHLVDPCKYEINGTGLSSRAVNEYFKWTYPFIPPLYDEDPDYFDDFEEIIFPDLVSPETNPFLYNKKYYYHTGADVAGEPIKWKDRVEPWGTIISSGGCPFGSGGLLDRTYSMALVEEIDLAAQGRQSRQLQPIIGICDTEYCDTLIDNPDCVVDGDSLRPDTREYYNCQITGCNVYTVYDAHRFPITSMAYSIIPHEGLASSWRVKPRPYIQGCKRQHPIDDTETGVGTLIDLYCGLALANTDGYADLGVASSPDDKCKDCEYSLYAEFAKTPFDNRIYGQVRGMSISYKMQDPITMTISFNDPDHEAYLASKDTCFPEIPNYRNPDDPPPPTT